MSTTVLFICNANRYRSRMAEILFNAMCTKHCAAISRGLQVSSMPPSKERISNEAVSILKSQGIEVEKTPRVPLQVTKEDIQSADIIIAMNCSEHKSKIQKDYPEYAERVQYWDIADLGDRTSNENMFKRLKQKVEDLLDSLPD